MGGSASTHTGRGAEVLHEQPNWLKAQASRYQTPAFARPQEMLEDLPALMHPACALHL